MKKIIIAFLLISLLAGCGQSVDFGSAEFKKDDYLLISEANNQFSFDLLNELTSANGGDNIFFSPISIHSALSMTYNGANGKTKSDMAEVLHLQDLESKDINSAYASFLSKTLDKNYEATLNLSNSLWLKKGYPFQEEFLTNTKDYYLAEIREMDFNDSKKAANEINQWIDKKTEGKIKKLIETVKPNTVAYLINAIYFNGAWQYPFEEEQTFDSHFYLNNGDAITIPFMQQYNRFDYFETQLLQSIRLPYKDNEASMIVLLPKEGYTLNDIYENLSFEQWNSWSNQFNESDGQITLPKFKIEYFTELNEPLINLGMGDAFSGNADFSQMTKNGGVAIDEVLHKSFIEVNEKGTEAAAATSVAMTESASLNTFSMNVNRPFFFIIQDNESEMILFMGEINDPE